MEVDDDPAARVFEGLAVGILPCFSNNFTTQLTALLRTAGALPAPPPTPSQLTRGYTADPLKCDVIVTDSLNFAEYEQGKAERGEGWAVTPQWVLQSVKGALRAEQTYFSPDPLKFFSGVCICCSDLLSDGDRLAINAGVKAYGGQAKAILTKEVTHFITPAAEGDMYKLLLEHPEAQITAVLPQWVDWSLSASTVLPTAPYEFPNPPLFADPSLARPPSLTLQAQALGPDAALRVQQMTAPRELGDGGAAAAAGGRATWRGRTVFFADDLEASEGRRTSCIDRVKQEEGSVADRVEEADVVVCKHRDGHAYNYAVKHGLTIGSLNWFYNVCSTGAVHSPTSALLHYPIPRGKIPEFVNDVRVTLTNYTGETRDYVRTLVELMGGRFTPDFSRNNTHVIASVKAGNKIQRALQWEKPIATHFWVEACFVAWRLVPLHAREEFTAFPPGVNLVTLVGKRGLTAEELKPWTLDAMKAMEIEQEARDARAGGKKDLSAPSAIVSVPGATSSLAPAPSVIAASYDTASAGGGSHPSPVRPSSKTVASAPSPLRTANRPAEAAVVSALPAHTTSLTAQPAPPPGSSARVLSSDDPLALKSPSQRRPPAGGSRLAKEPPHSPSPQPEKEELPQSRGDRALTSPTPAPAPQSSHTEQLGESSPVRHSSAAAESSEPPAAPPDRPLSTPNAKSTTQRPAPLSTQRGLDDSLILPTHSRRKAAAAATQRLHDEIMPDVLDYEKAKRNKTLMTGGRAGRAGSAGAAGSSERGSSPDARPQQAARGRAKSKLADNRESEELVDMSAADDAPDIKPKLTQTLAPKGTKGTKRKASEEVESDAGEPKKVAKKGPAKGKSKGEEPANTPATSKAKASRSAPASKDGADGPDPRSIHLLTTQVTLTAPQLKWLKSVGVKVTTKPSQCTHLVAAGISRTEKFLCSLAVVPVVVGQAWIPASQKAGHLLDTTPYLLKDPEMEQRYNMSFADVLKRAQAFKSGAAGRAGILAGIQFYATRQVETDFDVLKRIVEAHHGKLSNAVPRYQNFLADPSHNVLISTPLDKDLWKPLKDKGVSVYTRELILGGLIRQQMDFNKDKL